MGPAGSTDRQRVAPFSEHRLRLRVSTGPDVGIEDLEPSGHFLLPDPDVVSSLVERDMPVDSLNRRCRHSGLVCDASGRPAQDVTRYPDRDSGLLSQIGKLPVRDRAPYRIRGFVLGTGPSLAAASPTETS